MRVTSQYLFNNFKQDQQKINQELKKVTEQISSGKKIQNGYENSSVYNDSLRLDSQIDALKSVHERTAKAQHFTTATDDTLQDFTSSLRTFKNRLLSAANDTLNANNREAIATELEEEKAHMIRLANTQIGGEYLFSGSATSVKPIDENGHYQGNGKKIESVIGEGVSVAYNIDGISLFLGSNESVHKQLSTNVQLKNSETNTTIKSDDKLKDLVGGEGSVSFNLSGTKHDGSIVKTTFEMGTDQNMESLLGKIGEAYGNSAGSQSVKVELNDNGNIVITDLKSGKSQLEMKLRGKFNTNRVEFIKSNYTLHETENDDSADFEKNGSTVTGNVTLIADGKMTNNTTKLEEIAHGSLKDKTFKMDVTDINGAGHTVDLVLDDTSSFTVDGIEYSIYNADGSFSKAEDMSMGQVNDIIAMVVANELPAGNSADNFNNAIVTARQQVDVFVNQSGKLEIHDKSNDLSKISFAMYDSNAGDFTENPPKPTISFNSNNAVTTQKAEMDFFNQIDEVIAAVRSGKTSMGSENGTPRNIGIENAIAQIDQFDSHFNTQLAKIGTIEKSLTNVQDRAMSMELSLKELKSELTDVDLAEAYMNLNQLSLSYQAILSSVTKINSLTLLNYMK